ncbi:MAG: 30S ribosomal protein S3ae [Candidatus Thermoplasmatota archaeon]
MALARARTQARKTKDRWKSKQWFKLTAPTAFNSAILAETLSDEGEKVMGRTVEVTLNELTGDMKQMHIKLAFQVNEVVDLQAKTAFIGHSMTSDYVRRLVRRGNTRIPGVFDVETTDGSRVRVKPFAVTDRRCQTTQNQAIRAIMGAAIQESAAKNTLSGFLADVLQGGLAERMHNAARKIHPVRRVEIAKTEIVTGPTRITDETPVFKVAAPEAEPVATEGAEAPADSAEEKVEATDADDEE